MAYGDEGRKTIVCNERNEYRTIDLGRKRVTNEVYCNKGLVCGSNQR
jgi:hypothetical protein